MKLSELHPVLQRPYRNGLDCGSVKVKNLHYIVPPTPPRKVPGDVSYTLVSKALIALGKLPAYDEMDELDKLINYLFVRREAVQSSRIEGTWSTIDEVLTTPNSDDETDSDTASVRNYAHVLEKYFEQAAKKKERVFNETLAKGIHKQIMEKDQRYNGTPGQFRTSKQDYVQIGGLYNPAPPEHVLSSVAKVLGWLADIDFAESEDAGAGMTLPVRLAIGHSHFEAVHPFSDGNGRVGRAFWPIQMICAGFMPLYLSGYVEQEKHAYSEALQAAQKKLSYKKIVDFICKAIVSSSAEMLVTKNALITLPKVWQERGKFRQNSAAQRALEVILKYPIFTMEELKKHLECSTQAAANAIKQMQSAKVIRERTGNRRNRIFAAEEVIGLLNREHGSDVQTALQKSKRLMSEK